MNEGNPISKIGNEMSVSQSNSFKLVFFSAMPRSGDPSIFQHSSLADVLREKMNTKSLLNAIICLTFILCGSGFSKCDFRARNLLSLVNIDVGR